jgi:superoxide reductase
VTEKNEIYKCEICGNIIEMVHTGVGELVCCGEPMKKQEENVVDAAKEKHVPVIEELDEENYKIKVGEENHPMEEKHFIEWIEVVKDGEIIRKELNPNEAPEKEFNCLKKPFIVRAYCNIHGLWKRE